MSSLPGSAASAAHVYDSVGALLTLRRPDEALALVGRLAVESPDSFDVHYLIGMCQIAAGRVAAAEQAWRRATSMNPDHVGGAVLGVRCALAAGAASSELAWARAERARSIAPDMAPARFWVALAAARSGRADAARAEYAAVLRLDPGGDWPLYTAAEVDLALHSTRGGVLRRRATIAEDAARELLARDPQDVWAHELRARAAPMRWRGLFPGRVAEVQLGYTGEAARAGMLPPTGQLERQMWAAARPAGLAFTWAVVALVAAVLLDPLGLWPTISVVTVMGVVLVVSSWRRVDRVMSTLPAVARRRFVPPVREVAFGAAAVLGVLAAASLLILNPFSRERGEALGFGRADTRTVTTVVNVPLPTMPTFPPFPGRDDVVAIPSPNPPLLVPEVRQVRVGGGVDEERSWVLMRYWTFAAGTSALVALSLFVRACTLSR